MRQPVTHSKTTFSMRPATNGDGGWKGKWVIVNGRTGRIHLILDTESEADAAMDGIAQDAAAYAEQLRELVDQA